MIKVCIYAMDDGSFTVEQEGQEAEGMEMPGSPMDMQEDAAEGMPEQSFQSVDEALEAARMMLEGGQAMDPGMGGGVPKPMMDGEDDFVAGFKQARGIDQGF